MANNSTRVLIFFIIIVLHFSDRMMVYGSNNHVEKTLNDMKSSLTVRVRAQAIPVRIISNPKSSVMVQNLGRYVVAELGKQVEDANMFSLYEVYSASWKRYQGGFRYMLDGKVIVWKGKPSEIVVNFRAEVDIRSIHLTEHKFLKSFDLM